MARIILVRPEPVPLLVGKPGPGSEVLTQGFLHRNMYDVIWCPGGPNLIDPKHELHPGLYFKTRLKCFYVDVKELAQQILEK